MLRMLPVESSAIKAVGYEEGSLYVEYNAGGLYEYKDVPENVFIRLINADSIGKFVANFIKPNFDYDYRK